MLELRLGIGNKDAISRLLGVVESADIKKIWPTLVKEIIHPFVMRHVRENFRAQGRLGGQNWNYEGEPIYARYKQAMVGHNEVLRWQKGGKYERLFPSLTNPKHPYHSFRMTSMGVKIGTLVPYAGDLAEGGIGPFGERYPGRNPMRMNQRTRKTFVTLVQRGIRKEIMPEGLTIRDVRHSL